MSAPLIYFKNQFLPESECHISIHDRSFRFGDGVFETLLVINGKMFDVAAHMKRLREVLAAARIPLDISGIPKLCEELIAKNNLHAGYVRIIVSRGNNGANAVGYKPAGLTPYFLIQTVEKSYPKFAPLRLQLSTQKATQALAGKTNNALIYTLAMMEAEDAACDNALLLDANGHVCETASGNIFWVKNGALYTPASDLPMVHGTMRALAFALFEGEKHEGHFTLLDLAQADEVFMTNIATILAPIVKINPLPNDWPVGKVTQALRKAMDNAVAAFEKAGN